MGSAPSCSPTLLRRLKIPLHLRLQRRCVKDCVLRLHLQTVVGRDDLHQLLVSSRLETFVSQCLKNLWATNATMKIRLLFHSVDKTLDLQ